MAPRELEQIVERCGTPTVVNDVTLRVEDASAEPLREQSGAPHSAPANAFRR